MGPCFGTPHGNEIPFDHATFEELYGDVERWRRKVADRLEQYLRKQTYLPIDAEELRC